jgi:uncharacterized protein DUF6152
MRLRYGAGAVAALLMCSPAALAHHSFAMFDLEKEVAVEGVVKQLQYQNPHVWIEILVPDGHGGETTWSIEGGAPGMMTRAGWKSSTLKAGDKVILVMHPLKSGQPSGSLIRVTVPDGRVLGPGAGGVPPPPPTAAVPAR